MPHGVHTYTNNSEYVKECCMLCFHFMTLCFETVVVFVDRLLVLRSLQCPFIFNVCDEQM